MQVWSLKTNAAWSVLTLHGHTLGIRCLQLLGAQVMADGHYIIMCSMRQLVSGSQDCTIRVWDITFGPGRDMHGNQPLMPARVVQGQLPPHHRRSHG